MATTIKSLLVRIGVDVSPLEAGFRKAESTIQKNADQFRKAGRMMTIAGAAVTGIITGVVKAFANFDNAMTESTAIMGDLSADMRKKMAAAAKQMSRESTFAAKELAHSYFYLASAGLDAEQSIAALPVVTRFAQAGTFDLARATDLLTDAQSALGLSSKDAVKNQENMLRVSDVLVKANTLANASVSQFSEALTNKAGPSMRAYGVELESGVAVLAAFADQGVKGQVAGEQFSIVLRDLQRAAIENRKDFEKAGVAVFDANGNLNDMGVIVGQLEDRLGSMSAEQKKSELSMLGFQERSQAVLLTLLGTSEKIKEYNANLRTAQGTTEEVAKKQLQSLTSQLKLAWNSISVAAISLGEKLAPAVKEIAEKVSGVVRKIGDWVKENPKLAGTILKIFGAVGLLMTVLGPLAIALPGIVTGFTALGPAFSALFGPAGLATAAILGIALAIKELVSTLREAKKEMRDLADESLVLSQGFDLFVKLGEAAKQAGGRLAEQWNELMEQFRGGTKELSQFRGDWKGILKAIISEPGFEELKALLLDIASGVREVDLAGKGLSIRLPENFRKAGKGVEEVSKKVKESKDFWTVLAEYVVRSERVIAAKLMALKALGGKGIDLGPAFTIPNFKLGEQEFESFSDFLDAWEEKTLKDLGEKWRSTWDTILTGTSEIAFALDAVFAQFHANEAQRIDNLEQQRTEAIEAWYEREQEKIESTITNEEEKEAALEALAEEKAEKEAKLEEEVEKKRKELARKEAKAKKVSALFAAGINIAEALTKALTAGPFIGQIMYAIVAGLGAIQMAAIAAAPLPSFKEGGYVPEETLARLHPGEYVLNAPTVEALTSPAGLARMGAFYFSPTINIYPRNLDDRTIDEASEKIFAAMDRERRRRGL